ncbi:MAG TPA: hypothetical protein VNL98_03395 [Gemmatimonadales bacterium]|nr:hypothetical protein [Gemmatimonadales bacterium]
MSSASLLLLPLVASMLAAPDGRPLSRTRGASAFDLFVAANLLLDANRVVCNITDSGEVCTDPNDSPVSGGGFWPRGTFSQYVFNSGIQIAAIIPGADQPGFPWPGDTVGAFFFDTRGDQDAGTSLTELLDSRATSLLRWPSGARLTDPSLFAPTLLGRFAASQQDSWVRYWDMNSNRTGRPHPMGVLVEQRTLAWNYPVGNDDIIYLVYRLVNVTASDPARYAGLVSQGFTPDDIASFAQLGARFQERMRIEYGVDVPDTGFAWSQAYLAYAEDPDIGSAGQNYLNASLVFDLMMAWKSDFSEPTWSYPPEVFFTPFSPAPGFVATTFLTTPGGRGLTMTSNYTGGAPLPSPLGVARLWRSLSGNRLPTDGSCQVPQPALRRFCFFTQVPTDARGHIATGPFTLPPGQAVTAVLAKLFAAPVATATQPFIGANMQPGLPLDGTRLQLGLDTLRDVDRAMGWVSHTDADGDGTVEWNEVATEPRSLLWKAQLARHVVANRFQMPAAPEPPEFHVVPGDGRVTVVWAASASETGGDPYFPIASDPTTPLYDPNYRELDVEGYRIWRGTSLANLQVIAEFDYRGTFIRDHTGRFLGAAYGNACAPELGVTTSCPDLPRDVPLVQLATSSGGLPVPAEPLVQVRLGDRVLLSNGAVDVRRADTLVVGGGSGRSPLRDNGVPFVYTDSAVTNGVTYYYAVTAFDANSWSSGPSSLESTLVPKTARPRVSASNAIRPNIVTNLLGGDDEPLDTSLGFPAIDPFTGTFAGPIPPANSGAFTLLDPLAEALPEGSYVARIDSIGPGFVTGIGSTPLLHVTLSVPGEERSYSLNAGGPSFFAVPWQEEPAELEAQIVPFDTLRLRQLGIPSDFAAAARTIARFSTATGAMAARSFAVATTQGRFGNGGSASRYLSHSRWMDDGAAEPPDPTISYAPSRDHNSGRLTGVDLIWSPAAYRNPLGAGGATRVNVLFRGYSYALTAWYPADFVVTWGSGGAVTVRDVTHRVDLRPTTGMGTGFGFVSLASIAAAGLTAGDLADGTGIASTSVLTYHSLYSVAPVCWAEWRAIPCAPLSPVATLQPLDFEADGVIDGTGIVIVINGEPFFMKMSALPAPGTRWRLRAVGGAGMSAACTPALPLSLGDMTEVIRDCSSYGFQPPTPNRRPRAPGLRFEIRVTQGFGITASSGDLSRIHTVPDPYYWTHNLETATGRQLLRFVNLPERAVIRIYSSSGILVAMITHNDPTGGGEAEWDVRNRAGRPVASGVYFWHVQAADGRQRTGRFVVVNAER